MIKKFLFFLPLFALLFFSCKKQEKPTATFTLTATLHSSNSVLLNWTASNLTGFRDVSIYRSTQPIPDPTFDKAIDANLQIALISDNSVLTFLDSAIQVGATGSVYYKVVLNLSDRFIVSNQAQVNFNAFAINLPNNSNFIGTSFIVKRIPEVNMLYVFDFTQSLISAIDYSQKKIVATTGFSSVSFNANLMFACINNNNPELFIYTNGSIVCYNGLNLTQKYSFSINSSISDFKVKDGLLYELVGNGNNYIYTYNLSNFTMVNQTSLPYGSVINNNNGSSLFTSNKSSTLFVKYYSELYNSQLGHYDFTNKLISYNTSNGIPGAITNYNIPAINGDTTNSNNINNNNYIQVSPDGKYVSCNQNGDIYTIADNSLHNVNSLNPSNPLYVFSNGGNFMLSKLSIFSNTGQTTDKMEVYSLPGFNLVTSQTNQGSNSNSTFLLDDFMDNDTLLSYNISRNFINNQSVNSLTVQFKKVD